FQFIENVVRKFTESRCLLASIRLGATLCQWQSLQHYPLSFLFVVGDVPSNRISLLRKGIWFVLFR
ncbi:MAG: hypothetical protein J6A96_06120, partial [Clostridia bacterium]|nr:hypothetical protein [Clostridia bacterium]